MPSLSERINAESGFTIDCGIPSMIQRIAFRAAVVKTSLQKINMMLWLLFFNKFTANIPRRSLYHHLYVGVYLNGARLWPDICRVFHSASPAENSTEPLRSSSTLIVSHHDTATPTASSD